MDITLVKNMLGIKTTKHDTYLETVLPLMIDIVEEKFYGSFELDELGEKIIPSSAKIAIAKWIEFNMNVAGLKSESEGISYSYSLEVPQSIKELLPRPKVKFL